MCEGPLKSFWVLSPFLTICRKCLFSSAKKWHFGCRNQKTETTFQCQHPPQNDGLHVCFCVYHFFEKFILGAFSQQHGQKHKCVALRVNNGNKTQIFWQDIFDETFGVLRFILPEANFIHTEQWALFASVFLHFSVILSLTCTKLWQASKVRVLAISSIGSDRSSSRYHWDVLWSSSLFTVDLWTVLAVQHASSGREQQNFFEPKRWLGNPTRQRATLALACSFVRGCQV